MSFVGKNIDLAMKRTRMDQPTGRSVLAVLARHSNRKLISYPSQETIAERIGITDRQVRTYLRLLEDLGEIEPVQKGGNQTTRYRLNILSDDWVDRKSTSVPASYPDRKSTTAPKKAGAGSVASLDRKSTSAEVIEDRIPGLPASFPITENGSVEKMLNTDVCSKNSNVPPSSADPTFAEKTEQAAPSFSKQESDVSSGDVVGQLGDRAREDGHSDGAFRNVAKASYGLKTGGKYEAWVSFGGQTHQGTSTKSSSAALSSAARKLRDVSPEVTHIEADGVLMSLGSVSR